MACVSVSYATTEHNFPNIDDIKDLERELPGNRHMEDFSYANLDVQSAKRRTKGDHIGDPSKRDGIQKHRKGAN